MPRVAVAATIFVMEDVFIYRCPLCGARFRFDDFYEPMCTGPHPSQDDHAPEVMIFERKDTRRVLSRPK